MYTVLLILGVLVALPKMVWDLLVNGKNRKAFPYRFGFKIADFSGLTKEKPIWIHSVSMGETKAAANLVREIRKTHPNLPIVVSTMTETGNEEAKKSIPGAAAYFYLPFDFPWLMRKYIRIITPRAFIGIESDYWLNLYAALKRSGVPICVGAGKISDRSFARYKKIKPFARLLFGKIDLFCVQSEAYKQAFMELGVEESRLHVTGNLKFDAMPAALTSEKKSEVCAQFGIIPGKRGVVIGSTHSPEEVELLIALEPLLKEDPEFKIWIVPRHPNRFPEVYEIVKKFAYPSWKISDGVPPLEARIILVDQMGSLGNLYACLPVSIVAGSYTSNVGGHNVLEPLLGGSIPIFGPSMHGQREMERLLLEFKAGKQVDSSHLAAEVKKLFTSTTERENGKALLETIRGASARTWQKMESLVQ